MLKRMINIWKRYRYRFVPWIALNLNERTIRSVSKNVDDFVVTNSEAVANLKRLFSAFEAAGCPENEQLKYKSNLSVMHEVNGFTIERGKSKLEHGGTGVIVTSGTIPPQTLVALYPGTLYFNYEPILLQSISNPFIFRCIDGMLIDGNDKGISKYLYRSCSNRDRVGPYLACDVSWLTSWPVNPLAIGQYVNNQSKTHTANVAYQEIDIPKDFPFKLRHYLPNIFYGASIENPDSERFTRLVLLISTRTIHCGEELFSTYYTLVH